MIAHPSPSPHIQAFLDGSIGWLVLNRPERRNALNAAMWAAIPPLMKSLDDSPDVRVIVIRGAGAEAFAAGADISEFGEARNDAAAAKAYEDLNGAAFAAIRGTRKTGHRHDPGLLHRRRPGHRLGLRPARRPINRPLSPCRRPGLGLAYPLDGLRDLVATVGAATAKDMIFTARRIEADEALRSASSTGLPSTSRRKPAPSAPKLPLARRSPSSTPNAPSIWWLRRPGHISSDDVLTLAATCFNSADYAEGRAAFAEKRKPRFTGN